MEEIVKIPENRARHAMQYHDGSLILIGGLKSGYMTREVDLYNLEKNYFESLEPLTEPRMNCFSCIH